MVFIVIISISISISILNIIDVLFMINVVTIMLQLLQNR